MPGRVSNPIQASKTQRKALEQQARNPDFRRAERARIILCRVNGLSRAQTARSLGCQPNTVSLWTRRFEESGLAGLDDLPGRGRKSESRNSENSPISKTSGKALLSQERSTNMKAVADRARVSPMTVSRVLSNHPNVRSTLRNRVMQAVEDCGYQPDPELRKLMIHLRKGKRQTRQNVICSLAAEAWKTASSADYFSDLINGAREGATRLGFGWETFPLERFLDNPSRGARVLFNRGIDGILLPPVPRKLYPDFRLPESCWERFSVVVATSAGFSTPLRRVMPDYFRNMMLICSKLSEAGFQRIGLTLPDDLDDRTFRNFTGAFSAFHISEGRQWVPPCLYGNQNFRMNHADEKRIRKWYQDHKPDAIIINSNTNADIFKNLLQDLSITGDVPLAAVTILDPSIDIPGIDERPEKIGIIAAEALGSMIIHNEKGLPSPPTVTMVEGIWRK